MTPGLTHLRWASEAVRLAAYVLFGVVILQRAGFDVIGRVRRWIGLDAPGGDQL